MSDRVIPLGEADATVKEAVRLNDVLVDKQWRRDLDAILQTIKGSPGSRERALARTKLEECIMWLGMDLKRLDEPNPYPNSMDPSNTKVDPTADGLKL